MKKYNLYSKSGLPDADYVINPYIGCTHGCMYCYACFMSRFHGRKEPWGSYLEAKEYASVRLPKVQENKTILVGSVTDAYNPAEKKYQRMPEILKLLTQYRGHVELLTKSNLVLRDLELIQKVPDISVGISLAFTSERDVAILEPRASSVQERIDTLRILHENGISTYLFVAPYFPEITNLSKLLEMTKGYADRVCVENLNLRGGYKADVLSYIQEYYPNLLPLYESIYVNKNGSSYWEEIEKKLDHLSRKYDISVLSYFYHEKIKKSGEKNRNENGRKKIREKEPDNG